MKNIPIMRPEIKNKFCQLIYIPMNDKKQFRIITLALLGILVLLLLAGLFKTSHDLRISARLLKSAMEKVEESSVLVRHQDSLIRELREMNLQLSEQIRKMDSTNRLIQKELDAGFRNAGRNISTIKETLDKISVPQIK